MYLRITPAVRSNKTCNSEPIAAFIFMGKTGAGKSSMIKLLGGKDLDGLEPNVDDGLESCRFLTLFGALYLAGADVWRRHDDTNPIRD